MKFVMPLVMMLLLGCATDPNSQFAVESLAPNELEAYKSAQVILLGEQHDNPIHHEIQAGVLKALADEGRLKTVIFEQVDWTYQGTLAQLNRDNFERLEKKLDWKDSGWPDFDMYQPLFKTAFTARAKIVAGGLPKNRVQALYSAGYEIAFNAAEIERIKLRVPLDGQATELLQKEIFDGHCKMIPEDHVQKMIPIQRARDAALVKGYINEADNSGVTVFILGNGHARKEFGVPSLLRTINPKLKLWSVGIQEVGSDVFPEGAFDKVIITPKVEREDPCAQMKKHLDEKAGTGTAPAANVQGEESGEVKPEEAASPATQPAEAPADEQAPPAEEGSAPAAESPADEGSSEGDGEAEGESEVTSEDASEEAVP